MMRALLIRHPFIDKILGAVLGFQITNPDHFAL
jgi:hypothetical protein